MRAARRPARAPVPGRPPGRRLIRPRGARKPRGARAARLLATHCQSWPGHSHATPTLMPGSLRGQPQLHARHWTCHRHAPQRSARRPSQPPVRCSKPATWPAVCCSPGHGSIAPRQTRGTFFLCFPVTQGQARRAAGQQAGQGGVPADTGGRTEAAPSGGVSCGVAARERARSRPTSGQDGSVRGRGRPAYGSCTATCREGERVTRGRPGGRFQGQFGNNYRVGWSATRAASGDNGSGGRMAVPSRGVGGSGAAAGGALASAGGQRRITRARRAAARSRGAAARAISAHGAIGAVPQGGLGAQAGRAGGRRADSGRLGSRWRARCF